MVKINPRDFGPYQEAYNILIDLCNEREKDSIPKKQYRQRLQETPGQFYSEGTTWEDIFNRMDSWGWINIKRDKISPCLENRFEIAA